MVHTWTVVGCIMYTRIRLLLIRPFIFSFFFLQYSNIRNFRHTFLGTERPRRLKLGAQVDNGWMYRVYRNQAAAFICPFIFSFFFLSNFQTLKCFVTLFSGAVRPRKLKRYTHVDNGWMNHVYRKFS